MAKLKIDPQLIKIVFEARYEKGYKYMDRCGQTLIDIEEADKSWVPTTVNPQDGQMINLSTAMTLEFNPYKLVALMDSELISKMNGKMDIDVFIAGLQIVFSKITQNLGVEDFIRFGCRAMYMIPTEDLHAAEEYIINAGWVKPTDSFLDLLSDYRNDDTEVFWSYTLRMESPQPGKESATVHIGSVTRTEGRLPSDYLQANPRNLSKNQREVLREKIKETKKYKENPRYGVLVDIDQYIHDVQEIDISSFVKKAVKRGEELAKVIYSA